MDGGSRGERSAICGLCRGARRSTWPGRSPAADARLLLGAVDADRAQKRRTDGGSDSPGAGRREASIPASFCWQRAVVGRGDAGQEPALAKAGVGELVLPALERRGPVEAWIIDDTGFPKKGLSQ